MCLINKINMEINREINMENWVDNVCYNFGNVHSIQFQKVVGSTLKLSSK
jgi:hypothetical protein